jgi:hypothetical protein
MKKVHFTLLRTRTSRKLSVKRSEQLISVELKIWRVSINQLRRE